MLRAMSAFPTFAALAAHLDRLGLFRMRPGLERMEAVLARLDLKRPPFVVAQVAGTNGKGSTSVMLAELAAAHGVRAGLHISPHFVSVRERILINGAMLPEESWAGLGSRLMQRGGETLTYFEFVTCLAVMAFAEAGVDLAVMETGLGGAFDATTALEADIVLFTPIALDHQNVLGHSLEAIAADKAGAIRPGKPVLSGPQRPEALNRLERAALAAGANLRLADGVEALPRGVVTGMGGDHQTENARLALAGWRLLRRDILPPGAGSGPASDPVREAEGLRRARLPGRLHFLPPRGDAAGPFAACPLGRPPMILDGAHNAHGLAALGAALARRDTAPAAVVFSCLADKDLDALLPLLRALSTGPVFVPPVAENPRALDPVSLAGRIGLNAVPAASFAEALGLAAVHMAERLPEAFRAADREKARNPLLVCGSLYLLGEFFRFFPECLHE